MHPSSSRIAQHAALDLFVLGFPQQANVLLNTIHEYGLDTTTSRYAGRMRVTTEKQLQGAWSASDSFPTWADKPDAALAEIISTTGLPKHIARKAEERTLSKEDVDDAHKRLNANPDAIYQPPGETMTLGAVIQVALLAGEERLATSLIENNMKDLYQYLLDSWNVSDISGDEAREWIQRRQGLEHCPGIWDILASAKLGEMFDLRVADVDAYVKEGCALFKQRSIEGPARPYLSTSIAELVQMIENNIFTRRKDDGEDDITPVLRPGASEAQIAALEARLSLPLADDDCDDYGVALLNGKLPDDYQEFLRASNGIGKDIFFGADDVNQTGCWILDNGYNLFPFRYKDYHQHDEEDELDLIRLTVYPEFVIGTGEIYGTVRFIPPTWTRPFVKKFEKAYAEADESKKRLYERAALDMYGGIEQLRATEWLCVEYRPSEFQHRIWGGLKPFLEEYVQRGVDDREERQRRERRDTKKEQENKG
ncbi:hypothetical protein J4E93_008054 [Alternaria ventricosa]|uniref:uncharacterized protein n=1 Tax=Alternaria ventricosa TaxID=1187951 RepID=UPI0020C47FF5|nr:uncharacterized protein J4E93_008054 [Alternaria ventricosa]KAI4641175.1 hypothetical protein J4E93_008054 [Alternaria ventricosa]